MKLAGHPTRFDAHGNAFGFLRLLFASLVIVSHVPEVVDGDRSRELLSMLGLSMTFGGIAVYGFFVISGYLITGSFLGSRSMSSYLTKRVARIYPGFILASIVSLLIVAPLAGASFAGDPLHGIVAAVVRMSILARPAIDGAFAGQPYHDRYVALNGVMWTIQYEFLCYAMIVALGLLGVLRRPLLVVALAILLIVVGAMLPARGGMDLLFPGPIAAVPQLCGLFLAGSAFYLLRERVRLTTVGVPIASFALILALTSTVTATMGYAVFGAYLIFAAAQKGGATRLSWVNDKIDISYGLYLYAWPVQQLLIRYMGGDNLFALGVLTWLIAAACGTLSWFVIEKPAMQWVKR